MGEAKDPGDVFFMSMKNLTAIPSKEEDRAKKEAKRRELLKPNLAWKTMVKIIPLATEDLMASYAIIGLQSQSLDASGRVLTSTQRLSLAITGAKAIIVGLGALAYIIKTKHMKGKMRTLLLPCAVLEMLVGLGLGSIAEFLAFPGQERAPEPAYRFPFLIASILGLGFPPLCFVSKPSLLPTPLHLNLIAAGWMSAYGFIW